MVVSAKRDKILHVRSRLWLTISVEFLVHKSLSTILGVVSKSILTYANVLDEDLRLR